MPPASLKRGGARNFRERPSWQISQRQGRMIRDRAFDAWYADMPMSRFITLAWGMAGIEPVDAVKATGHFVSMARSWMRHHGYRMPWVWV